MSENVVRKLFGIAEAAKAIGVSPDTVRRLIKAGALKSVRISRRAMVSASEIERVCAQGA